LHIGDPSAAEVAYSVEDLGCVKVKSRNIGSEKIPHTNCELVATEEIDKSEGLSLEAAATDLKRS
jgi:hypothetical protein